MLPEPAQLISLLQWYYTSERDRISLLLDNSTYFYLYSFIHFDGFLYEDTWDKGSKKWYKLYENKRRQTNNLSPTNFEDWA